MVPLLFLFTACQEQIVNYNDGYDDGLTPSGPPTIEQIVLAADTAGLPKAITAAEMGDIVVIQGSNLSQIKSLTFNGIEADLKSIYAVNSYVVVPVPRVLFDEADATGKVVIETSKGTAEANLTVAAPKLVVDGFYNEFANVGDTVDIVGRNFDLFEVDSINGTVKAGDTDVEILAVSERTLTVVVPTETPDGTEFTVSSKIYAEKRNQPARLKFREGGGSLMGKAEFENWDQGKGKGPKDGDYRADGKKKGEPKPLIGLYRDWFIFCDGNLGGSQFIWAGGANVSGDGNDPTVADFSNHKDDYEFKFEMLTTRAFTSGSLEFEFGGTKAPWKPSESAAANTNGKWRTIRFDAKDALAGTGTGWVNLAIQYSQSVDDAVIGFAMCNFRVAKKVSDTVSYEKISK
ncbi:MAG: hypothetical protein EZS26_002732 [Candidatus Ordinivivax streblomastigis]|uniref:Surface glycan-binding protein B xyloglucan binding domain-containing protein n=1 Tax=Candidatus Ordinivivax streblomastigis TaxID=2540710 RepID=A0A5M8NWB7_9BACT|nr:MAG: hypothetical protein EZS26_002732 [Candidatus Ordinivivax streblomastigis]